MTETPKIEFETRISGIPAVVVCEYEPPERGLRTLADGQLTPDINGALNIYEVRDRKGYHAAWLERKLDAMDIMEYDRFIDTLWTQTDLPRYPK